MPPTLWSNSSMPESSTRPSRLPATSWYGSPMCTTATIASEWSIRPEARTDRPPTATARSSPSFSSTPTTTTTRSKTHSSTWSPSSTRRPSPDHAASKATIREGAATTTITRRDHGTPIPPSDSMATLNAGFDPTVIAIDRLIGGGGCSLKLWVVEELFDIGMQRALVAFERQGVIALLIDDLLGDVALAVEGINRHGAAFQR